MNRLISRQAAFASLVVSCLWAHAPTDALAQFRTIDGTNNNANNPNWGAVGEFLLRESFADYADGLSQMKSGPNPRTVSNLVFDQNVDLPSAAGLSSGFWQWGQFIDHDYALVLTNPFVDTADIIPVQPDPDGIAVIPFGRSDSAVDGANVRQQINSITSYIDGSQVYGSDAAKAAALRTMSGGKLKVTSTSGGDFLPLDNQDVDLGSVFMDDGFIGQSPLFVAGDLRANEQPGLTAMHTLFVREHNRIADGLAGTGMTDEQIYQTARRVVGAEIQAITYNEWLPMLLGPAAPNAASVAYDQNINATLMTEFSSFAFRVGHTMLNPQLLLADDSGVLAEDLDLRDVFFRPQDVFFDAGTPQPEMLDKILLGLNRQQAQEIDSQVVDDVRSFLFTPGGGPGMDLVALNLQRGRDHGLPGYNAIRQAFGLSAALDYSDVTADLTIQQALEAAYGPGNVGAMDPFVGAMAEDHVPGANVGELIQAVLAEQFRRLRDGDSFFFMRSGEQDFFAQQEIAALIDLNTVTMAEIIALNTDMEKSDMPLGFFTSVPEPSAWLLFAWALLVHAASGRRRCRATPGDDRSL